MTRPEPAIVVERTLEVTAPPEAVIAYLRDFGNTTEWDDGTVSCEQVDDGSIAVGTRFRNVSRFAGRETELTYTLVDDRPDHVRFEGRNKTARTADDITARPSAQGPGSRVDYRAELDFVGWARILTPALRLVFGRLADRTERQLQTVLDDLPTRGPGSAA
ncbi:carbon monoxide dehydrogenase subunit G [Barrientosiimonas humi]|uniref:Carbon monoxide dehydrogenase subunit G n=1 Tax=Barrientosiimonas humi TaxID=999931 RepID=A0A542X9S0_9MICO|nr:SRPBCC family protein [Barrientosiimonas humi]TQL32571.1 carbon monoxide dehydrogenase subunit G [Barrientosiimonas humi]CAG7572563.1 hypothetical protein BH39T_PBIAJDOK_01179 [Barrientosiimonas humi]